MLFNSPIFVMLFLPVVVGIFFLLNGVGQFRISKLFLLAASLFFYAWLKVDYLLIFAISILVNFAFGHILSSESFKHKKLCLWIGVCLNLLALGYYKYANFFADTVNGLLKEEYISIGNIAMPLAISFFTFTQISYLVDTYRGQAKRGSFLDYALFVSFFPKLIQGPIARYGDMVSQFEDKRIGRFNSENFSRGLFVFTMGLAKKVLIADYMAALVAPAFADPQSLGCIDAWAASLGYTFQLYFDFSGYCDMACGIGMFLNIRIPINFNSPYKALSIQDFWRRWHITLSSFLRDYMYIPLGGSRKGQGRTLFNLLAVFLLCGLWHGAGWTFVVWGGLHGLASAIHRVWSKILNTPVKMPKVLAWFITFNFVNAAWVFFRADSISTAVEILRRMYLPFEAANQVFDKDLNKLLLCCAGCLLLCLLSKNTLEIKFKPSLPLAIALGVFFAFLLTCIVYPEQASPFIYFNF